MQKKKNSESGPKHIYSSPDLPDLQDTMILMVTLDLPDLPGFLDIMVLRVMRDHLENLVFRALVDRPATMVPRNHLGPGPISVFSRLYPALE